MSWFFAEGGVQKGPVGEEEFQRLAATGTIRPDTLVWREGMPDWKPFGSIAAAPAATEAGPPATVASSAGGQVACSECGRSVPASDTVVLGGRVVCAACKPRLVQRMVEGAGAPGGNPAFDAGQFLAGLRARGGYPLEIGSCLSRGFDLVKANFWPCVGIGLLVFVGLGAAGSIPCVGPIAQLLLTGPFMGGLYVYFLRQVRGTPATIDDVFSTFRQPLFKELMLASVVVQAIPVAIAFVLGFGAAFVPALLAGAEAEPNPALLVPVAAAVLLVLYISFVTFLTYPIVADAGAGFWDGIKLSVQLVHMRFFTWMLFVIVAMFLGLAGLIALCVGIFVVAPVLTAAVCYAWTDILRASAEGRTGASAADLRVG